ncbi:membrane lipoprotein lipid attachment site-containing protein [Peribacillus sp. NPDC097264]|uniref:membrane lipoprotein lipid attachment site-containing protein n=1 Tax=Peribacillus sp. NPDC097264 TaxID=3390616 RepID=UPI003D070D82
MKKIFHFLGVVAVLAACSNSDAKYGGAPLNIAVIGETPEFKNNNSHTTIYLHDDHANKEDAWYFYVDDKKNIDQLYTDLFKKIEEV